MILMTPISQVTRYLDLVLPPIRTRRCRQRFDAPQTPSQVMSNHRIPKRRIRRTNPLQLDLSELFDNADDGDGWKV